ncbi:MAG: zinc-ribbon domain-containing protein [Myxococcales bacterium]|nr:zinc-ribbon domain-containing protein [Myxococcales bacterium]
MKFLCDNCKAKYQIPDEKVAGRTLRMTCRKCGNDILIRGAGVSPSVAPPPAAPSEAPAAPSKSASAAPKPSAAAASAGVPKKAAVPAKAAAVPAKAAAVPAKAAAPKPAGAAVSAAAQARPSALGADFRKKVGNEDAGSLRASMPSAAPPPATTEEWHVAVNDVPVGPIRRDEIARKIGTGAVTGDSLAWREGFDDWRPLREIPQLASLLEQRRRPSVPPAPRTTGSSAGPRPTGPRGRSGSGAINLPPSERSSANLVPLGGRAAAPVAPAGNTLADAPIGEEDDFALDFASPSSVPPAAPSRPPRAAAPVPLAAVAAPVASAPVAVASAPASVPQPEHHPSQKTPVWVWGMLACGIFFGVVLGMKGSEWFGTRDTPEVAVAPTPPAPQPDVVPQPLELPEADVAGEEDAGVPEEGSEETTHTGTSRPTGGARTTPSTTAMAPAAMADDGAFAQFESVGGMTVTPTAVGTGMSAATAPPLEASAVQRVVNNNRRQLQTCYERAARGQANPPRARMDVNVTVGRSGTVTAVTASGSDFGGLGSCIEQSVRRWRFPASSDGGATRFPVVFSAGG